MQFCRVEKQHLFRCMIYPDYEKHKQIVFTCCLMDVKMNYN